MSRSKVFIAGLGCHHPDQRLTNADLEVSLSTTDAWIVDRTGIEERRRAPADTTTSDLGARATRAAMQRIGWTADDLELIVCATSSPDTMLPASATHLGRRLGTEAVAFDVNAACAGFAYGLAVATHMMHGMGYRRAALCCADTYTKFVDYSDRRTAVLFGDGAATALLQTERPRWGAEVVDITLANWSDGTDLVSVPVGGTWHLEGPKVKAPALKMMVEGAQAMIDRHGIAVGDLRAFMAHQANYRILEAVAKELGIRDDQHWSNVRTRGNQGAAGVLSTLAMGVEHAGDQLLDGDLILLTVVGAGFTSGCVLLRWIDEPGGA